MTITRHVTTVATLAALAACGGGPPPAAAPAPAVRSPDAVAPTSPLDRPPARGPSLYTRLGGVEALRLVVHAFAERMMADSVIGPLFRGVDHPALERMLVEQLCQATGGPCRYSGRTMPEAHRGLAITDAMWNTTAGYLVAALTQFQVPAREQQDLLAIIVPLKPQIVGQ